MSWMLWQCLERSAQLEVALAIVTRNGSFLDPSGKFTTISQVHEQWLSLTTVSATRLCYLQIPQPNTMSVGTMQVLSELS
jgi:hypothetical protein